MLLTISETCTRLRIGRTTLYKLIGFGELRALKSGKKTLIEEDELNRWIASLPTYRPQSSLMKGKINTTGNEAGNV